MQNRRSSRWSVKRRLPRRAKNSVRLREIEAAKTAALQDLARTSVDTAVNLAGKIVQRQLSPEDHARLISDALQSSPVATSRMAIHRRPRSTRSQASP